MDTQLAPSARALADIVDYVSVDPRAARFGPAAECYERGRPSYPAETIARLVRYLRLSGESTVLDLAAGTGKLSRLLVPPLGRVVAVQRVAEMRQTLAQELPTVVALEGTAEAIPLADGSVEAVFVGEAFHWFRTDEAAHEIARVLTPRGGLALLWNRPSWSEQDTPWLGALCSIVEPHRAAGCGYPAGDGCWGGPAFRYRPLRAAPPRGGAPPPPPHAGGCRGPVASWSWIAGVPEATRDRVIADVRDLLADGEEIVIPYRTEVVWTRAR